MNPGEGDAAAVKLPTLPSNSLTLLETRYAQSPVSVGAKRTTIRRPPSQYAGNASVRCRGERNSAFMSTV